MKKHFRIDLHGVAWMAFVAVVVGGSATLAVSGEEGNSAPPPVPEQEQPEVLSGGPVHEAFAGPVNLQPQDILSAPREPPPAVDEQPPDRSPEKQGLIWVPGYWAWDDDDENFIWVSACWRAAPPGMIWTPGYWAPREGAWAWVSGYWKPIDSGEPEYLPEPPPMDAAPPPEAESDGDSLWVPACAYWQESGYVMRPGYWLQPVPDWVWTPAHYIWTPRGYLFAPGHWDHALEQRGVLYAPVRFPETVTLQTRPVHAPLAALDLAPLSVSLFASPRYSHVYEHARWRRWRAEPDWKRNCRRDDDRRRGESKPRVRSNPEPPPRIVKPPVRSMPRIPAVNPPAPKPNPKPKPPRIVNPPARKPLPPPKPNPKPKPPRIVNPPARKPLPARKPTPPPAVTARPVPPSGDPRMGPTDERAFRRGGGARGGSRP